MTYSLSHIVNFSEERSDEIMAFRFESLEIWELAIEYGNKIYDIADSLPNKELFGLGYQFRRSAVSISNNIAEGSGSSTVKDFKNYLDISIKSVLEIVSMLFFAKERRYINESLKQELYNDVEILIRKIRAFKISLNDKQLAISNKQK